MLLEECRTVLPGIQALFGFQLIVVFNPSFSEKLSRPEQVLHFVAIGLVIVAVAIIMAPAALHRQGDPTEVTSTFIRLSTRLLLWSMPPLAVSICLEFFLIARVVFGTMSVSLLAAGMLAVFLLLWFVLPRSRRLQRLAGGDGT